MNNNESSFLQELIVVIVIYRQRIADTNAFKTLTSSEVPFTIFIYDNSPDQQQSPATSFPLIYHHDKTNPGVSKAYNIGSTHAKTLNKKWLLLADQDTSFPESFFDAYQNAIRRFPESELFSPLLLDGKGILSPFVFSYGKGKRLSSPPAEEVHDFHKMKIINSGLLISLDLFEKVRGYDERFPLDHSDIVFTDRLLNINQKFNFINVRVTQSFSGSEELSTDRFNSYCSSLRLYKRISKKYVPLNWVLLSRALKLSLQHANFQFMKIAIASVFSK